MIVLKNGDCMANILELVDELNTLMDEYEEVDKEANFWYLRVINLKNKIYHAGGNASDEVKKELEETVKKSDNWREKQSDLFHKITGLKELLYWEIPPIKTDGVIDLRKNNMTREKDIADYYDICLHGTKEVIGSLKYEGYHFNETGDVRYTVYPPYQGHHYAYRALCLIGELLKENGIEDFWVTVKNDNIPSIKTVQRYGVEVVDNFDEYTLYQGRTTKREELETGLKV